MKTKLMIVAAGKGTRNSEFTLNGAMPKILSTTGKQTILENIIDSYKLAPIDEIAIICTSTGKTAIRDIMRLKMPDIPVTYHIDESFSGTTSTVVNALKALSKPNDSWYINWSDVFATFMPVYRSTLFTDDNNRHRNLAFHGDEGIDITGTDNLSGNVAGIFYINRVDVPKLICDSSIDNDDFDRFLIQNVQVELKKMSNVSDIGDQDKFVNFLTAPKTDGSLQSRFFNDVKVIGDTIQKSPRTIDGERLHNIELSYYKHLPENDIFPKLLDYHKESKTMVLEKINGVTIHEALTIAKTTMHDEEFKELANNMVNKFKFCTDRLAGLTYQMYTDAEIPKFGERMEALYNELHVGLQKRVDPIIETIDSVIKQHNLESFGDMPITKSYNKVKAMVTEYIVTYGSKFEFSLCHGDTNTDNVMYETDGLNMKFIDPRGYFGGLQTLGFGPRIYDLAKFVYGMTGYSEFNSCPYIVTTVEEGNMVVHIPGNEAPGINGLLSIEDIDIPVEVKFLIGIIWMRLSTYISNDPMKSVTAYLHGNALVTKYFKEMQ